MVDVTPAPHAIPYMTDDDQLAAVAARSRAQAERVAARLPTGAVIQVSGTAVAGGTIQVNVTFPTPFTSPPHVTAVVAGFVTGTGALVVRMCDNISTTGFRLTLLNSGTGSATATNMPVRWLAVPA